MGNVIRTCGLAFVVVALWAHSTDVARTQAVTDGLVAHWPMDKIEGNAVKDASGGSDADIVDSNLATGNGQVGKAVEFDGAGYGDTGVELMEFGDGYSITAWIRTSEVGVSILSKGNGAGWGPSEKELYVADAATSEGPNTGPVEMVGWGCAWIRGSIPVNDGVWHHIAITWDDGAGEGHAYVDAVEGTHSVGYNGCQDNPGDFVRIGFSESVHSAGNFDGAMDDLRIYDRALSEAEVTEVMEDVAAVSPADRLPLTWGAIKRTR